MTPPPEQALESPLAPNTVPQKEEEWWLFSLMDRLEELGISFKLPEGWADFQEEEFNLVITDALAATGIDKSDLPEGWTTVIRWRKRKTVRTLPSIPEFFVGEMHKHPRYQEPEEQWEWEVSIYSRLYNLMSDDTFDALENLPPIPGNCMFPEMVPQDAPDDDDDEAWTAEIYRRISNLQSRSKSATDSGESLIKHDEMGLPVLASLPDLSLNQSNKMGLPDLGGLPDLSALPGLPDIPDLPDLPDHVGDLEERFENLLTDTSCANDETLVSGGILNLGIEMNRNDIPELDLANVPGAVPPRGVGGKKKEEKKIKKEVKKKTKKVKKQLKKEADRHGAVAKKKKEKAEELRQSIDYCERKSEALQFAIDVNKNQPIEKEQCYTEDTEEKEKKKKKNQYLLVCGSNGGCNYGGYKKQAMKKQSVMQKPKEHLGMLQIQVLFNQMLQREDSLV